MMIWAREEYAYLQDEEDEEGEGAPEEQLMQVDGCQRGFCIDFRNPTLIFHEDKNIILQQIKIGPRRRELLYKKKILSH